MSKAQLKQDLWNKNLVNKIHQGFLDSELEMLCKKEVNVYKKLFPVTEMYSLGKCYREWLNWPRWLPIPVYGDHGICVKGFLSKHELESNARVHLTFNHYRKASLQSSTSRNTLLIPHPYVTYRKLRNIERSTDHQGTLVFYSHSLEGVEIKDYDFDAYFSALEKLPEVFKPLTICMHMHDIEKGYHKIMRKYGIPIVSAGNTLSDDFIDRFYDIITKFSYATSNKGGSEVFYCAELGLPFFIYGDKPKFINHSNPLAPLGVLGPRDELSSKLIEKKEKLFRIYPPEITQSQKAFTSEMLSLDIIPDTGRLRRIFLRETIRLSPNIFRLYKKKIGKKMLWKSFRKLYFRLKGA